MRTAKLISRMIFYLWYDLPNAFGLILLPIPLFAIWRSAKEVLEIAPSELNEKVLRISEEILNKHGFNDFSSAVSRRGRQNFVEVCFVGAPSSVKTFDEMDRIRSEIANHIGVEKGSLWLSVDFVADRRWM